MSSSPLNAPRTLTARARPSETKRSVYFRQHGSITGHSSTPKLAPCLAVPHLGEHLLNVESGAHAQRSEAPSLIGLLGDVGHLLRPVGIAVDAHQRDVVPEEVARRQNRPVPAHGNHQVYLTCGADGISGGRVEVHRLLLVSAPAAHPFRH